MPSLRAFLERHDLKATFGFGAHFGVDNPAFGSQESVVGYYVINRLTTYRTRSKTG
jgi:hypothetical protein